MAAMSLSSGSQRIDWNLAIWKLIFKLVHKGESYLSMISDHSERLLFWQRCCCIADHLRVLCSRFINMGHNWKQFSWWIIADEYTTYDRQVFSVNELTRGFRCQRNRKQAFYSKEWKTRFFIKLTNIYLFRRPGVVPVTCTKDTSETLTGAIMHVGFCLMRGLRL